MARGRRHRLRRQPHHLRSPLPSQNPPAHCRDRRTELALEEKALAEGWGLQESVDAATAYVAFCEDPGNAESKQAYQYYLHIQSAAVALQLEESSGRRDDLKARWLRAELPARRDPNNAELVAAAGAALKTLKDAKKNFPNTTYGRVHSALQVAMPGTVRSLISRTHRLRRHPTGLANLLASLWMRSSPAVLVGVWSCSDTGVEFGEGRVVFGGEVEVKNVHVGPYAVGCDGF